MSELESKLVRYKRDMLVDCSRAGLQEKGTRGVLVAQAVGVSNRVCRASRVHQRGLERKIAGFTLSTVHRLACVRSLALTCGNERVVTNVCGWRTDGTHPDASAAAIAAATDILGGVEGSLTGGWLHRFEACLESLTHTLEFNHAVVLVAVVVVFQ
jgi:hypothetical protein